MTMTVSTDDRVLDALALNWPKLSILPSGDTEEVSLASVRDLAQHLHVSENTVRSSVRRLVAANLVRVYQLRDTERGVRRLYVTTEIEKPLSALGEIDLLLERLSEWSGEPPLPPM